MSYIMPSFVILCTCIFAVWLVEYVICSFLQYSFIRRGVSQWRWWSGGLGLFLVKMPVEWSRHSCSVVCYSFVFRCVECYFLWEELSTSVIIYYLRILNSYSFVLYYQFVIVCLGWFLDEGSHTCKRLEFWIEIPGVTSWYQSHLDRRISQMVNLK